MRGTVGTGYTEEMNAEGEDGQEWEGLSEVILGRREWFERWLDGERECESILVPTLPRRANLAFLNVR